MKNEKKSWDALFHFFNKVNKKADAGYKSGEKVAIKINQNNTDSHQSSAEINANPTLILSLLKSLVNEAGIAQENITLADPSRFITNNIYDKCHSVYPTYITLTTMVATVVKRPLLRITVSSIRLISKE